MSKKKLHPVLACNDGIFNTYTGLQVNLLNPLPEMFCLKDIAKGLSNTCRFGGQIPIFNSVAQHTLIVWYLAPEKLKLAALLHDASEAYLGDVIKPLKVLLEGVYGPIEQSFTEVIFNKYHVPLELLADLKMYDLAAVGLEHNYHHYGEKEYLRLIDAINMLIGDGTPYKQLLRLLEIEFSKYE